VSRSGHIRYGLCFHSHRTLHSSVHVVRATIIAYFNVLAPE
jgi:hypothetical protein